MADGQALKRRGILAAASAVVAGIVAKQAAQPVTAAANMQIADTSTTVTNTVQGRTLLQAAVAATPSVVFLVDASHASGDNTAVNVFASGGGFGVVADSPSGTGVAGTGMKGIGMRGVTSTGLGVKGEASGTGGIGVYAYAAGVSGTGLYGFATAGTGVYGVTGASNQYGVLGTTTAPNSTAVAGITTTDGSSAFSGGTTNPNAYAGVFQGNVVIGGRLVVSDPSYKSGALAHPDGSHRLVYCVESPESWIEDVGTGTLAGGKAIITFDKDFAAVTHTDEYHVFLTEYGANNALYVAKPSAMGFEVHADKPGASSTFSWKVMVKAKSSVKSERLGKFTMPNIPLPDVSKFKVLETPPAAVPRKP